MGKTSIKLLKLQILTAFQQPHTRVTNQIWRLEVQGDKLIVYNNGVETSVAEHAHHTPCHGIKAIVREHRRSRELDRMAKVKQDALLLAAISSHQSFVVRSEMIMERDGERTKIDT